MAVCVVYSCAPHHTLHNARRRAAHTCLVLAVRATTAARAHARAALQHTQHTLTYSWPS
jgi:hypothetical protein